MTHFRVTKVKNIAYNIDFLSTIEIRPLFLGTPHNVAYRLDIVPNSEDVPIENIPPRMDDLEDKGEVVLPCW